MSITADSSRRRPAVVQPNIKALWVELEDGTAAQDL
jgi:hypothetical protein